MLDKKFSKKFIDDYINNDIVELEIDAIGLWQIIGTKDRLNLSDEELEEFIYRSIIRMIEVGAKPIVGSADTHIWTIQNQYGTQPEEIANNIIKEWKEKKGTKETIDDVGGIWFATEDIYNENGNAKYKINL